MRNLLFLGYIITAVLAQYMYYNVINQVILYWPSYKSEVCCIGPAERGLVTWPIRNYLINELIYLTFIHKANSLTTTPRSYQPIKLLWNRFQVKKKSSSNNNNEISITFQRHSMSAKFMQDTFLTRKCKMK